MTVPPVLLVSLLRHVSGGRACRASPPDPELGALVVTPGRSRMAPGGGRVPRTQASPPPWGLRAEQPRSPAVALFPRLDRHFT